jgi:hypothetical protein
LDPFTLLGYLFQVLINWSVKILLTAFIENPGRYILDVNGLTFEPKPSQNALLFHLSGTEFATITFFHCFHNLFFFCRISGDNQ